MLEAKDYIFLAAILFSILITVIFSFIILISIKKNIRLSNDLLELSKSIIEKQNQFTDLQNNEYRDKIYRDARAVYQALEEQSVAKIENAPRYPSLRVDQMQQCFSEYQIKQINEAWNIFNSYLKDHWITENGEFVSGLNRNVKEIAVNEAQFAKVLFSEIINMSS